MQKSSIALLFVLAAPFASAQNLLTNGSFDTDVTPGWSLSDAMSTFTWSSMDAASSPTSGSGHFSHGSNLFFTGPTQCVNGVTAILYDLKVKTFIPSGQMASGGSGSMLVDFYASPNCSGTYLGSNGSPGNSNFDAWTQTAKIAFPAPAGVSSALVTLQVSKSVPQMFAFDIFFDDAFFGATGTPVELQSFEVE